VDRGAGFVKIIEGASEWFVVCMGDGVENRFIMVGE
jgi:hypothetical protein